ncbi:MAG: MoxR family ATPase [Kiritimatiellae bacterium]|jgi:MoxR-like ATPase|nr:MoxR family ATPase [Kiritimatiellia bacterium]
MQAPIQDDHVDTPGTEEEIDDVEAVAFLGKCHEAIRDELSKVIVGQAEVVDELLISILTRSHALLVGVPGLAKTLLVQTLSRCLDLEFKRIQFTPDLMPSDITGTEVMFQDQETGERDFRFRQGPVFSNIVLADEINRTPPKTQAAMLEAMQERRVTVGGVDHKLPNPFFVLATQNPIEQEGTYTLPEAQLDRFLFLIKVDYPSTEEEIEIMRRASNPEKSDTHRILDRDTILWLQQTVARVPVADHVFAYAEKLVRRTRGTGHGSEDNDWAREFLRWGAGPRASINLISAAKAHAALNGQFHVSCDDVASIAHPVLRHRIMPTFQALSQGITSEQLVDDLIDSIPQT